MYHGMQVKVRMKNGATFMLHNVTEVHYNYPSFFEDSFGTQVAYESDIHQDGHTFKIVDIVEFEVIPEEQKHETTYEEIVWIRSEV